MKLVFFRAGLANQSTHPEDGMSGLILKAADTEFVVRILQYLLKVILNFLSLVLFTCLWTVSLEFELNTLDVDRFFFLFFLSSSRLHY